MSETTVQFTAEEARELLEKFRVVKHNLNNHLAVIMALSELAQRNPAHYEKLAKAVLQRGPDVVEQMNKFQTQITAKLTGELPPENPPPPSGVFL